ncbi:MAG TPA: TetR/AcrR family transcriptional regulator [Alphaproteobacteria bacterium]|nr:TetR/AcrR family transcriptional regulator [Alphaproteobacteria bacterium]
MPVRLSAIDRRQQILRVATALFARRGYQGTTTRQIAERAGVNEALLFRHFPSKENLYWTLIEELCRARGRRQRIQKILEGGGGDAAVFAGIAREFLVRTPRDRELTRLLWFNALETHVLSDRFFRTFVDVYFQALAGHIRRRIREGTFRKVDPLLAARGFMGMVVYHFLVQELFRAEKYQKFDANEVAETLTEIWLAGIRSAPALNHKNGSNGHHAHSGNGKR